MNNRGFALATVMALMVAIFVMGMGAMYMSEMGFRSISAETRWHMAEKAANAGLEQTAGDMASGNFQCGGTRTMNFNGVTVQLNTVSAGGSCFLWASATSGNTRVVKVGILTAGNPGGNQGALVIRQISNLTLGGSAAITSCDPNCRTSAVIIGNSLNNLPAENLVSACPNNPSGATALVDPLVVSPELLDINLTNTVFNNINNTQELLSRLSTDFRVSFNNGTPDGITGQQVTVTQAPGVPAPNLQNTTYDVCSAACNGDILGLGNIVQCNSGDPSMRLEFTWSNDRYNVVQYEEIDLSCDVPGCRPRGGGGLIVRRTTLFSCFNLDFGQNGNITFQSFTGGNRIAGNNITITGNLTPPDGYPLSIISRNQVVDNANGINVNNVNVFAKNIVLDNNGLVWNGGVLYSGGPGQGNFNINLNANSNLGTTSNPVLIISNGSSLGIQRNGNASINGLVYATDNVNNFSISGNGTFDINGAVVSNSRNNNNVNISGNFSINFNANVLRALSQRYGFVRGPQCTSQITVRLPYTQTKTTTY